VLVLPGLAFAVTQRRPRWDIRAVSGLGFGRCPTRPLDPPNPSVLSGCPRRGPATLAIREVLALIIAGARPSFSAASLVPKAVYPGCGGPGWRGGPVVSFRERVPFAVESLATATGALPLPVNRWYRKSRAAAKTNLLGKPTPQNSCGHKSEGTHRICWSHARCASTASVLERPL